MFNHPGPNLLSNMILWLMTERRSSNSEEVCGALAEDEDVVTVGESNKVMM